MRYVVLFEDEPSRADVRPKLMPQHLKFLQDHGSEILEAGPLSDAEGNPAGGLWIVEAQSAKGARQLVEVDPFWPAGLRRSIRVLSWRRVFADGKPIL